MISSFSKFTNKFNFVPKFNFSSKIAGGDLYTWGSSTSALGFEIGKMQQKVKTPTKVEAFDGNVHKVVLSKNHSAVITTEGDLFTFGNGSDGILGHNNDKEQVLPKKVDFFSNKGLKVVDVALGESHSVCLTDDGDVWTWGSGGFNALGHGTKAHRFIPTPVEALRTNAPTVAIASGDHFVQALNEDNEVWSWGGGEFGVFGDGSNDNLDTPQKHESLVRMKEDDGVTVKKIKSCGQYTLALMNNGSLWGWGRNDDGQIGVQTNIGIEIYETANYPIKVDADYYGNEKIVDFSLGETCCVFYTDANRVYWMGLRLAFEPTEIIVPGNRKIVKVGASHNSFAIVTDDGSVFCKRTFLEKTGEDLDSGLLFGDISGFQGRKIREIGGSYNNHYAIVM